MPSVEEAVIQQFVIWATKAGLAVVLLLAFYILARLINRAIIRIAQELSFDSQLTRLFARTAKIVLTVFGVLTALGTLGINVSALVAGLGLTGFAVGFALKDTITNLLAGVLILLYKPFKIDNRISVANFEGVVVAIDLRYTQLEESGNKVLIPNSKLFTDPIIVYK